MPELFERLRALSLAFPGAYEDWPWGHEDPVFKAANKKIFAMTGHDAEGVLRVTVKLSPDEAEAALMLPFVSVAAYVGRYGWVTARVEQGVEFDIATEWVARSHELVTAKPGRRR
ncbi:MAG: MmcQ/YjbR family DNA-binding protein [Chloroflexi bacterium]|nr:MmcQ/YjbR family DNA-binding protein [Chloroflexota bacterium]